MVIGEILIHAGDSGGPGVGVAVGACSPEERLAGTIPIPIPIPPSLSSSTLHAGPSAASSLVLLVVAPLLPPAVEPEQSTPLSLTLSLRRVSTRDTMAFALRI